MSVNRFGEDAAIIALEQFKSGKINRRNFMTAMAGVGLAVAFRPSHASAAVTEVVVCNWGGAALDAFQKSFGPSFKAATGMELVVDGTGPSTGAIRAMVESKNVTWDATDGGMTDAVTLGKGGFVEPIDYSIVDKSLVGPGMAAEFGIANYTFSNVLAYDAKKTKGVPPTGWADFFDLEKFPGKRTMCKWIQGQLESVLLADGVKPENMYPLDVDRAFKKLEPLLPHLIFWESGAQSQQLFRDGEVVMGNIWHTRANLLRKENKDFTWTWEQNLVFSSAWSIPKGNPAGKKVYDFINSSLQPDGQVTLLRLMGNGPSNPKALALMTEDDKAVYNLAPENSKNNLIISADYYADNEAALQNKFLDFISR